MEPSWRDILVEFCDSPQKKQDIAERVGSVSVRTIDRWLSGTHKPQKDETIRKLAEISDEMRDALEREFPEAFQLTRMPLNRVERVSVPSEFYHRTLLAYAYVPRASRHWTIFRLVANQMIQHLDPNRAGFVLLYCSPRSQALFEEGAGNTLWSLRQFQESPVGATSDSNSWLMQAVTTGRPFFVQSCITSACFPPASLLRRDIIQSMGYVPLHRSGVFGGGVLLCSTEEDFFTPLRQALIEEYCCLLSLMLSGSDFPVFS